MSAKRTELSQVKRQETAKRKALLQFLLFNLVGLINTAVDFAVYSLLVWADMNYMASQVVSYLAGMANSYLMNSKITFRKPSAERVESVFDKAQAVRFVMLNMVVLGVGLALLFVGKDTLGWHAIVAKIVVTCITVVLNFVGSKWWVFSPEKRFEKDDENR
ncbi:GtrA family protein [Paenibacillus sp. NEAU-GSW1]|uniref:GtrA family protein n=1 Tax=Paenibacillus sp. NEAU-GSW1 TaxID=2682486 RepID=UPI0012E10AF4|nr:GtrA family protein [Paenibacillus sp. NEAU-GSW1]MUT67655.1 GtrA family protein [Paenibacillus sp. NEAU-GSW1]